MFKGEPEEEVDMAGQRTRLGERHPWTFLTGFLGFLVILAGCWARPAVSLALPLERIKLPPGFQIEMYAGGVENARSMVLSPTGTLFVGTRSAGKVYAVTDRNGDFQADEVITLAQGLNSPNGVAFRDRALYVAEVSRVLRFDSIESRLGSSSQPVV